MSTNHPFSHILARMGVPLERKPRARGGVGYSTGVNVGEGYDIAAAAVREGHKCRVGISGFNASTVTMTIYASCRERFHVKVYAANENQAEATCQELTAMTGGDLEMRQEEFDL